MVIDVSELVNSMVAFHERQAGDNKRMEECHKEKGDFSTAVVTRDSTHELSRLYSVEQKDTYVYYMYRERESLMCRTC